jgi:hypothetical protein
MIKRTRLLTDYKQAIIDNRIFYAARVDGEGNLVTFPKEDKYIQGELF